MMSFGPPGSERESRHVPHVPLDENYGYQHGNDAESFLFKVVENRNDINQTLEVPIRGIWYGYNDNDLRVENIIPITDPFYHYTVPKDPILKQLLGRRTTTFHQGLSYLLTRVEYCSKYTKVNLSSCYSIDDEQATYYAAMLRRNKTLKILDLSHTYIGNAGATELANALKNNETLIELNLDQYWSRITDQSIIKRISESLERNKRKAQQNKEADAKKEERKENNFSASNKTEKGSCQRSLTLSENCFFTQIASSSNNSLEYESKEKIPGHDKTELVKHIKK